MNSNINARGITLNEDGTIEGICMVFNKPSITGRVYKYNLKSIDMVTSFLNKRFNKDVGVFEPANLTNPENTELSQDDFLDMLKTKPTADNTIGKLVGYKLSHNEDDSFHIKVVIKPSSNLTGILDDIGNYGLVSRTDFVERLDNSGAVLITGMHSVDVIPLDEAWTALDTIKHPKLISEVNKDTLNGLRHLINGVPLKCY